MQTTRSSALSSSSLLEAKDSTAVAVMATARMTKGVEDGGDDEKHGATMVTNGVHYWMEALTASPRQLKVSR